MAEKQISIEDVSADNIPIEFVKSYLVLDCEMDNLEELEVQLALKSATSHIRNYTKTPKGTPLDDSLIIPILMLTSHFLESKTTLIKANQKLDSTFTEMLDMNRGDIL